MMAPRLQFAQRVGAQVFWPSVSLRFLLVASSRPKESLKQKRLNVYVRGCSIGVWRVCCGDFWIAVVVKAVTFVCADPFSLCPAR